MPKKGHSEEQIVAAWQLPKLAKRVAEICRKLAFSQ